MALGCSAEERETGVDSGGSSAGGSAGSTSSGGNAGSTSSGGSSGSTSSGGSAAGGSSAGSAGDAGTGAGGATGGSAGIGGSAGTSATCAGDCLPPAPNGWSGPVAMYEGNAPPACVGDFAGTALSAKSDFEVGQDHCACACDPPTGEACGSAGICPNSASGACLLCLAGAGYSVAPGACTSATNLNNRRLYFTNTPAYTATGCQPRASNTTIDQSGFRNEVVACDMADPGGTCNGGAVCTPKLGTSFQAACVIQSGDVACPAGPYSVKVTTYSGFNDNRSCTACTCGSASGTCNSEVVLVDSCNPIPFLHKRVSPGECSTALTVSSGYLRHNTDPQGSCPASAPGTTGEAKPTGAATLCCLQPN